MVAANQTAELSTDREIERRISFHLAESQRQGLRSLAVNVVDGCVLLRGRVGTFYEMQLAIQSCQSLAGLVRHVDIAHLEVGS